MSFLTVGNITSWSAHHCYNIVPADEFIKELGVQCSNPRNLLVSLYSLHQVQVLLPSWLFLYLPFFLSILALAAA